MQMPSVWRVPIVVLTLALLMFPTLAAAQDASSQGSPGHDAATRQAPEAQTPRDGADNESARPRLDVIFVPTPQTAVDRMLELARVGRGDSVIDLGSGDGRIAITAAKRGARAMGVDLDPQRIAEARKNHAASGVGDRVRFVQQNLFETDLSQATVLTMYLLPQLNLKLRPRILDLKPGTRIVSHDFSMGEWEPDIFEEVEGRDIMLWIVPAKVHGNWEVHAEDRHFELTIKQEFQAFGGHAQVGDRRVPLRHTNLVGDRIEFSILLGRRPVQFEGRVENGRMSGRIIRERQGDRGGRWTAKRS